MIDGLNQYIHVTTVHSFNTQYAKPNVGEYVLRLGYYNIVISHGKAVITDCDVKNKNIYRRGRA